MSNSCKHLRDYPTWGKVLRQQRIQPSIVDALESALRQVETNGASAASTCIIFSGPTASGKSTMAGAILDAFAEMRSLPEGDAILPPGGSFVIATNGNIPASSHGHTVVIVPSHVRIPDEQMCKTIRPQLVMELREWLSQW